MANSAKPTNKVFAGGAAGAISVIIIWAAKTYGQVEIPPEVAVAIVAVITFALQYVITDEPKDES